MKLLLAAVASSPRPDGVSRHAANVARCLTLYPQIERIDLLVGDWQSASMHALLGDADDRVHVSEVTSNPSALARNHWYWSSLPQLARRLNSDLVHLGYPVPITKSAFPCPIVITLHDLYPYDIPANFGYPKVLFNRIFLGQCLRAADRIACVSESTKHRLEIHYPEAIPKALTIHNAITASPSISPTSPIEDWHGEPFLLCVAQHRRNKNIPLAIRVFKSLLRNSHAPHITRLVLIGSNGPETADILSLIHHLGLEDNITLLRGLTDPQLHWCYAHCELLLATSTVEGFGLPIVEAMLHRCRIVCSDIPAFREVGGSYCDYVPLNHDPVPAFEQAALQSLADRKFRTAHTDLFSAVRIGQAYLRLYQTLLHPAQLPSPLTKQQHAPTFERGPA